MSINFAMNGNQWQILAIFSIQRITDVSRRYSCDFITQNNFKNKINLLQTAMSHVIDNDKQETA